MKLLRFTSEDNNGIFSSSLDQELVIPPKSKIALASCALELEDQTMVINSANDTITFQILSGALRTVRLNHTNGVAGAPEGYNSTNYQVLLDDIQDKINSAIGSLVNTPDAANQQIQFGSEIGKQCQVSKDRNGKIEIAMNSVTSSPFGNSLSTNIPKKQLDGVSKNCLVIDNPTTNDARLLANTGTAVGNNSYTCSVAQNFPIARGCGVHRVRFSSLENNGLTGERGGASISLHTTNPNSYIDTQDITLADIAYGIKGAGDFSGAGKGVYHYILNGVETVTTIPITVSGNSATKDVMSIEIVGSRIRGVVYKDNGVGNPPLCSQLFNELYDNVTPLYASYSLHGAGDTGGAIYGCRIDKIRFTPDPYQANLTDAELRAILPDTSDEPLSRSTPTEQVSLNGNHDIRFSGDEVHTFLGYDTQRQPQQGFLLASRTAVFTAQNSFKAAVINDCFLIEMLNLRLESYDFHSTQRKRKNILAVLPFDDNASKCIFQPSNLAFLDLSNQDEYRTSEIKLRIIRSDYSPVELTGLSSVVVYLDS